MSSSTARALTILDELAHSASPLGVTEIARALSLPPGTVFRSLDALLRAGLVARYRASARYVPGPAAERLQRSVIAGFPAREVCLPYLRQLASISGETASLHVRVGWYAVRICSVPGTGEVMTLPPPGEAQALSKSCAGQAILAFLPTSEITAYRAWARFHSTLPSREGRFSDGKSGRGQAAVRSRFKTRMRLNQLAARGFAVGDGAIAFAVRTNGSAVAAITIERPFAGTESADQLSSCREVIANIEALSSALPSLFANPFAHLDPDSVTL
jgi:DNA-binding IclR family transcriptional regulator